MFLSNCCAQCQCCLFFRRACSIELKERVIVTGGISTAIKVQEYTIEGWQQDLADLLQGRWNHGCGHFTNRDNVEVKLQSCLRNLSLVIQVFLVTGGFGGGNYLSSTEILTEGDSSWTIVGNLPKAVWGIRGVSLNNRIIMTGEQSIRNETH